MSSRFRVFATLTCLLLISCPILAQPSSSPLRGHSLSVMGEVGGPAGSYTIGLEHLFVRSPTLQLGMYIGGSYGRQLPWGGTSLAITAGALAVQRFGAIGSQPVAVEGGLGVTRVHSDFDSGSQSSTTTPRPYLSGALRMESSEGRFAYRLGFVLFSDENDPALMLPVLGIRIGL